MIKIEAKTNEDIFDIKLEAENTNTFEILLLISRMVDLILENDKNIKEKDIYRFVKNRRKYMEGK